MIVLDWLLFTTLGRIVTGALAVVVAVVGFRLWLAAHDAGTRHAALAGYVKQVELDTTKAKLAETERQLAAGRKALDQYAKILAAEQEKNRASDEALEQEIKSHEAELAAKGRSCHISNDDRRWLLKP
jgi:uncharacterized protein YlxW (UPF0749 family)